MKIKRSLIILMILAASVLVLAGCGGGDSSDEAADGDKGEKIVLKLGHIQTEGDIWHQASLKFAEEVARNTNGQVEVKIYPNSTLGGDRDMAEGLQMGSVDFALIAGVLGNFEPSLQILELPYLFTNEEEYNKVVHGEIGQELLDRLLESSNIRGLGYWDRGPRQLTSNKPINSIDDVQGLKMRVPEIPAMVEGWKAIGANPTPMAWSEVYTGLEQGVIDGQENPIPFIHGGRIHEVQKYIAMTDHKYEYVVLAMSNLTWEKLSPEHQKAIQDAAAVATEYQNQLVKEQTESLLQEMVDSGMTVTYPDKAPFIERARSVHQKFADQIAPDIYEKIIETLKA